MYKIIGKDKRYGKVDCYGAFDNLRECTEYMNSLNRSLGNIVKFKIEKY